jgi:four helix bundle protein
MVNGEAKDKKPRQFDLEDRLIDFAVRILGLAEALPKTRVGNHIAAQLVRCGTSPAANYGEARSAESRKDFIHKMKVVLKELRESRVWLLLIQRKALIRPPEKLGPILTECSELISIFVASVGSAEGRRARSRFLNAIGGSASTRKIQ